MNRLTAAILLLGPALLFTACAKNSGSTTSTTTTARTSVAPAATAASPQMAAGASIYNANCATCHGSKGQGQTGAFPPLDANGVVTGDPKVVIRIVKLGLTGPVRMKGVMYNGQMPAWNGTLSDAQIASVITYVRGAWSNAAPPVTTAEVGAQK